MIDLFSSQFEFFIGNKRNGRHTLYGKILSILIILLTFGFFVLLLAKLNNHDIIPKIIEITHTSDDEYNVFEFDSSPISFFIVKGKQKTHL